MLSFNFCCIDGQFDKLQQSRAPSLKVQTYLNQIEFIVVIFDTKYCHFHDCHILDNATKHCLANGSWTGPTNYLECLCMVGDIVIIVIIVSIAILTLADVVFDITIPSHPSLHL